MVPKSGSPQSPRLAANREQSIFRHAPRRRFTTVDNAIFDTAKLSATAIGVACLILSKHDDWQINLDQMARETREGKKALRRALQELATAGYVMRVRKHHADGTVSTVTLIADYPKFARIGTPEERIHGYAMTPAADMTDLAPTDLPPTATSVETDVRQAHNSAPTDLPVGDTSVIEWSVTDLPPADRSENRQVGAGQVIHNTVLPKTALVPDPGKRSSSFDADPKEEEVLPPTVREVWSQTFPDLPLPVNLQPKLAALARECGVEAVGHGIRQSLHAKARTFRYLAACARNYVPAAPPSARAAANPYRLDVEPAALSPDVDNRAPKAPAVGRRGQAVTAASGAASGADAGPPDLLAAAWKEVRTELGLGAAGAWLEGSWLEDTGLEQGGKHLYRLRVADARHVAWLATRTGKQMSRILSSLLGQPAIIEITGPAAAPRSAEEADE